MAENNRILAPKEISDKIAEILAVAYVNWQEADTKDDVSVAENYFWDYGSKSAMAQEILGLTDWDFAVWFGNNVSPRIDASQNPAPTEVTELEDVAEIRANVRKTAEYAESHEKYMVVTLADDGSFAYFTDSFEKAREHHMNSECGMGWPSEIYERITDEDGITRYDFLYC